MAESPKDTGTFEFSVRVHQLSQCRRFAHGLCHGYSWGNILKVFREGKVNTWNILSVSRRVQLRLIKLFLFLFNAWYVSQRLYSIPWRLALLAQALGRFPQIEQTSLSSKGLLKRWLHWFLHEWKVVALYLYFVASWVFKMCFAWYWISGHDRSTFLLPYWPEIRIYLST